VDVVGDDWDGRNLRGGVCRKFHCAEVGFLRDLCGFSLRSLRLKAFVVEAAKSL